MNKFELHAYNTLFYGFADLLTKYAKLLNRSDNDDKTLNEMIQVIDSFLPCFDKVKLMNQINPQK